MRRHWGFFTRAIVFMAILAGLAAGVNHILTPKFYFDNTWPTTSGYKGFYRMPEDSVDVLFFGSSHAASNFNPQILFNEYGIRSYNLGCEQQNLLTTYYWLKEALRFQSPQAVIVDTYLLFPYNKNEPLNSAESCTRKAFDSMKWSKVKWEAVHDICRYDGNQSLTSYYFPNIRYHTRWTGLMENDFIGVEMEEHYELKGYAPLAGYGNNTNYAPFQAGSSDERAEMVPLMKEYLDRIADLCRSREIQLILVKTPTTAENIAKYNALNDYAAEKEISFMDFNEETLYQACGFSFAENMHDSGHGNIWGAEKISSYLGAVLYENFGTASGVFSEEWEKTDAYYQNVLHDCELTHITDICAYLEAIRQDRYAVFIAAKGNMEPLPEEVLGKFRELGLAMDYLPPGSYYAAIHEGIIREKSSQEKLVCYGSVRDRRMDYSITSAGADSGVPESASILIDNAEYSKNGAGINFVIYSNDTRKVIDSACYNGSMWR